MKVAKIILQACMFQRVHAFTFPSQHSLASISTTRAIITPSPVLVPVVSKKNLFQATGIKNEFTSTPSSSSSSSSSSSLYSSTSNSEPLVEPIGKGIARDYKARLPLYKSDITDGLNIQCLAATLFLFFACLAPAVGFGGLFAVATGGAIGTIEMVSSTAGKIGWS